ncbi:hypothetical protein [Arthrobacter sp. SRS-W-1-2016]|uniref:hypothetical protein n=1 Tax=Arthrobacter sp. SRS-W-1-2016 TaxID=1930254 RepID=UPI00209B3AEF|nr:hypothetical protein [Arthrobacter sp. SRS-W-1-2016]
MPSSPGKMDLSALSGLKKRVLQPVPDSVDVAPVAPAPETALEPAPEAPDTPQEPEANTEAAASPVEPEAQPESQPEPAVASTPAKIEPAEEEHSGHVTLYLPKDLNQWLGEHHDSTGISYPGIVLNAISWAAGDNRFGKIFAPDDSPIPANDIFGRAPAIPKLARGSIDPATRPIRFRKDHMQVIISLARTWTADNRNAFFVGVLTAYREQLQRATE